MNTTVARIVEILFQDYELTDELLTIKDEVMSNCQERFQDCVNRGLTEDEAISAVIESLKGMEEVLSAYPRRVGTAGQTGGSADDEDDDDASPDRHLTFSPEEAREIEVSLASADVTFEPSPDDRIHVALLDSPILRAEAQNGRLRIFRDTAAQHDGGDSGKNGGRKGSSFYVFEDGKGFRFDADSITNVMKNVGRMMRRSITIISSDAGIVRVQLPVDSGARLDLHTTSGDLTLSQVSVGGLRAQTVSGNMDVELAAHVMLPEVKLLSSSGDVEVRLNARLLSVQSVSGDLTVAGRIDRVQAHTTSGDMEISSLTAEVNANTVSGDLTVQPEEAVPMIVSLKSTSGDLNLEAPDGATVTAQLKSLSGDVHNRCRDEGPGSLIRVSAQTVSGDIYIR